MRCCSPVGMPTSAWPVGFSSRMTVLSKSNRMRAERVIDSSRPLSPCWRAKVWPTSDTSTRLRTSSDRRCCTGSQHGRRIGRRRRDVVGAGQVDAQVGGGLVDLARGAAPAWRPTSSASRPHRPSASALPRRRRRGVDSRCARRTMRIRGWAGCQAAARLVVVQHRVGQEGIEVPAFDQPGARFGVGDLQRALLDRAQVFVVARGEVEGVFLGRGGQQRQAADVVQQAGQVGFLELRVVHALRQVARDDGRGQRILPEARAGRCCRNGGSC